MRKIIFIATFFLTASFSCLAQWGARENVKGTVYKTNGKILETTLVHHRIKNDIDYVLIKDGEETKKIKKKDIDKITVGNDLYVSKPVFNSSGKRILKDKKLVKQLVSGRMNLYVNSYDIIEINEFHKMATTNYKRKVYYGQKEGEEAMTMIFYDYENFDRNREFREALSAYFSDHEIILEKIDKGEFTYKNVVAIAEEYNK